MNSNQRKMRLSTQTPCRLLDGTYTTNAFYINIQTNFFHTTLETRMNIPNIDLRTFIIQIAQGALVGLGEIEDPETKQTTVNCRLRYTTLVSSKCWLIKQPEIKRQKRLS